MVYGGICAPLAAGNIFLDSRSRKENLKIKKNSSAELPGHLVVGYMTLNHVTLVRIQARQLRRGKVNQNLITGFTMIAKTV